MTPRCDIHGHFMTFCKVCQSRYCRTCGHPLEECDARIVDRAREGIGASDPANQAAKLRTWRRLLGRS
jgi:hypothetical protein